MMSFFLRGAPYMHIITKFNSQLRFPINACSHNWASTFIVVIVIRIVVTIVVGLYWFGWWVRPNLVRVETRMMMIHGRGVIVRSAGARICWAVTQSVHGRYIMMSERQWRKRIRHTIRWAYVWGSGGRGRNSVCRGRVGLGTCKSFLSR